MTADHHPPHIYLDDTWYVITAATRDKVPALGNERSKALVRDTLRGSVVDFGFQLRAWVVLDDHYHLLLRSKRGEDLPRFVARLHGSTSRQLNLDNRATGRQVWHNYWDTCVRNEAGLWTRFNYIHHNPVKHGCVRRSEDWPFSSYGFYLRTKGLSWLADCEAQYPAVDFLSGDGFERCRHVG